MAAAGFDAPPRRFYKAVDVAPVPGGFAVRLDGRVPKSPKGSPLVLPTKALAQLAAAEWASQGEAILLSGMTSTRRAVTAIDQIPPAREAVARQIAHYAGSDVLCDRAEAPEALVRRQAAAWDPILDWAADALDLRLECASGVVHLSQAGESLGRALVLALDADDMTLTALAEATALFGSAVLAFALQRGRLDGSTALDLSRLDEIFQIELWGLDEEAAMRIAGHVREAQGLETWFGALA